MEKVNPAGVTLDDIVFESRNKAYGAYALRQSYNDHMVKALLLTPVLVLALLGTPVAINQLIRSLMPAAPVEELITDDFKIPPGIKLTEVVLPAKPKPAPASAARSIKTVRNVALVATQDQLVNPQDKVATQADLEDAVSGLFTLDGTPGEMPPVDALMGPGDGGGKGIELNAATNEPFISVEEMPEFPGGQAALLKFIGKHLRFPAAAQQSGTSGIVYVSFVISPTGKVSDVAVLKGIDAACDAEAVRVISKMPDWKPGRQSGRTVPVRYSLPIRFAIQ